MSTPPRVDPADLEELSRGQLEQLFLDYQEYVQSMSDENDALYSVIDNLMERIEIVGNQRNFYRDAYFGRYDKLRGDPSEYGG